MRVWAFPREASHGPCRGPIRIRRDPRARACFGRGGSRTPAPAVCLFGASNPKLTPALFTARGERFAAGRLGPATPACRTTGRTVDCRLSICQSVNRKNRRRSSHLDSLPRSVLRSLSQCLRTPQVGRRGRIGRSGLVDLSDLPPTSAVLLGGSLSPCGVSFSSSG